MASISSTSCCLFFFLLATLASLNFLPVLSSTEFDVGGTSTGWAVPDAKNFRFYNLWASKNRFLVGDIIFFKYKKDSVMVVSEDGYKKCNATHPLFFSNTGKSKVVLDRPGLYYFISGDTGHCEKGQKMIIKVMGSGPDSSPANSTDSGGAAAAPGTSSAFILLFVAQIAMSIGSGLDL